MKKVLAFIRKALFVLSAATLVLLVLTTIALLQFADKTWWGSGIAFGPRWVLLVPLGTLLPAILLFAAWRAFAVWLLCALVTAFGVLDLRVPVGSLIQLAGPDDKPLSVMTWNCGGDRKLAEGLRRLLADERIDLVAVEEWDPAQSLASSLPGWHVAENGSIGVASRYPVKLVEWLWFSEFALGSDGQLLRVDLQLGEQVVHVYALHLETPRDGLEALLSSVERRRDLDRGIDEMERNIETRRIESAAARRYIDEVGGQFIILGDFNLTVESRIYRRYWRAFANAFSNAGWGLGHTKRTRRIGTRIDHVLCGPGCDVSDAYVGRDLGSDHLPMIGKLRLHPALPGEAASAPTER